MSIGIIARRLLFSAVMSSIRRLRNRVQLGLSLLRSQSRSNLLSITCVGRIELQHLLWWGAETWNRPTANFTWASRRRSSTKMFEYSVVLVPTDESSWKCVELTHVWFEERSSSMGDGVGWNSLHCYGLCTSTGPQWCLRWICGHSNYCRIAHLRSHYNLFNFILYFYTFFLAQLIEFPSFIFFKTDFRSEIDAFLACNLFGDEQWTLHFHVHYEKLATNVN